jgi:hypothetical protein
MPFALSPVLPEPPRYVEYASEEPAGLSFVTNALFSAIEAAWFVFWTAPDVVGKFVE